MKQKSKYLEEIGIYTVEDFVKYLGSDNIPNDLFGDPEIEDDYESFDDEFYDSDLEAFDDEFDERNRKILEISQYLKQRKSMCYD